MNPLRPIALATALAALCAAGAGAAPSQPSRARACFRPADAYSWAPVNDRIVNLKVNLHDVFQLTLLGDCPNIDWSQNIAIRSRGAGWICDPLGAEVIAPGPVGPRHCAVQAMRKLTPEEVAALPKGQKP